MAAVIVGVHVVDGDVLLRHIVVKWEAEHISVVVGVRSRSGGEHITSRSGSFTLVSILMSPECLRSAELAGTIEAGEHPRSWKFWFRFWGRNGRWLMILLLLVPEIINQLGVLGVGHY